MKKLLLTLALSVCAVAAVPALAQQKSKPAMDHSVYDNWKNLTRIRSVYNSNLFYYSVNPQEGDIVFVVYDAKTGKEQRFDRFYPSDFSVDGKWMVGTIRATYKQLRDAKINKEKKRPNAEAPKDTLAVVNLQTGAIHKYPNYKSLSTPDILKDCFAFMLKPQKEDAKKKQADTTKAAQDSTKVKAAKPAPESNLYVMNMAKGTIDTIKNVDKYRFMRNGTLAYITKLPEEKKDSKKGKDTSKVEASKALTKTDLRADMDTMKFGLFLYEPATKASKEILIGRKGAKINLPVRNTATGYYAFMAQLDTAKKAKNNFAVYMYNGKGMAFKVADSTSAGLPKGWIISENGKVSFSRSGKRLFFGTSPKPAEKDTTLYDFERAKLDIWSWDADYNQPMQLLSKQKDLKKTYTAFINVNEVSAEKLGKLNQIADENFEYVMPLANGDSDYAVVKYTSIANKIQTQWDVIPLTDYYVMNVKTGEIKSVAKESRIEFVSQSVDGKWRVGYNYADSCWYSLNVPAGEMKNITKDIPVNFYDESNDRPMPAEPYRGTTFLSDNTVIIPDKYDYWKIDLEGKRLPVNFTNGVGRANKRTLRAMDLNNDTLEFRKGGIDINRPIYLSTFNEKTKMDGVYELLGANKILGTPANVKNAKAPKYGAKINLLTEQPAYFGAFAIWNDKTPKFAYTKGRFETGVNVWFTADKFVTEKQLSDINPQQREYNWGTAELFNWKTADGIDAEGIIFKPEDFDPNKKYPVMIYFYEKNSETLYMPRVPAPSRSTVNIPMFVSNGYIVFVPDMYYKDGHPGKSAMKSLMPAVEKLEKEFSWIDGSKMAIQGQSWGGYQVAYIITQTDKFAAAGAGAPVSNMTSAYGGMRWGSGMTRQFQYEQTQSRIGKNLWDGFDLYVENSPLFFAPAVKTPVLIMHNDRDGAVPWYQGIEFFTGLRRLGKVAWLLQYNDEDHNLVERKNAKDLSIRLQQFFDHYLKGAPMPKWMTPHGRPAVDKDFTMSYELCE